ncbi:MAG: S8 family serine peptidase [bacterium]
MNQRPLALGIFFSFLALLLTFTISSVPCAADAQNRVPGRYIVVLEDNVSNPHEAANEMARMHGLKKGHVYQHALKGFSAAIPDQKVDRLRNDPRIKYIERDITCHAVGQTLPTGVDRIDAEQNATANINGVDEDFDVDIAIIDTGIDTDHPDLDVRGGIHYYTVITGAPWARGTFVDDNYDDDNGHGSHVAGTAAAIDNGVGVVGVAPGARLWAVKVLNSSGSGYMSDIIAGVDWVTLHAEVIEVANMSLGGQGRLDSLRTAIQNSVSAGIVYVVAAGNDGQDVYGPDGTFGTNDDFIPAAYPEAATISAMADSDGRAGGDGGSTSYGSDDSFASFSNYSGAVVSDNPVTSPGAAIDLLLPGVDILSTYKNGEYAKGSGTSMASPHATGLAALYIAANGRANNAADVYDIRQALIDSGVAQTSAQGLAVLNDPDEINLENIGWAGAPPSVPVCGDGTCEFGEDCSTCEADCGPCPYCGDGSCDSNESCSTCPADCSPCCGDGTCDADETCSTCPEDCGSCPTYCGDGTCDADETCSTCEADCGPCPYCGDGSCNGDETCSTCPEDCGQCPPECLPHGEPCDDLVPCCSDKCHPNKGYCL